MAFSTQKIFFDVPFLSERTVNRNKDLCQMPGGHLKSYESTTDQRAWSMDAAETTQFLTDYVHCPKPTTRPGRSRRNDEANVESDAGDRRSDDGQSKRTTKKEPNAKYKAIHRKMQSKQGYGQYHGDKRFGVSSEDSVLNCASRNMDVLQELLTAKKPPKKCNTKPLNKCQESQRIKNIMTKKFDPALVCQLRHAILNLRKVRPIPCAQEQEMLKICDDLGQILESHELWRAENAHLKRIIEKLSARANLQRIQVEPEISRDITYLQGQVDCLRRELSVLRHMEDDFLQVLQDIDETRPPTNHDAEHIRAIVAERNALREKCKAIVEIENRMLQMQQNARESDSRCNCLTTSLRNQGKYLKNMEDKAMEMEKYCRDLVNKQQKQEKLLKSQIQELQKQLACATIKAQKTDCVNIENKVLQEEVKKLQSDLTESDCQYKKLMKVVDELKQKPKAGKKGQSSFPDQSIEALTHYVSVTLDEVMKELDKRDLSSKENESSDWLSKCEYKIKELQSQIEKLTKEKCAILKKLQNCMHCNAKLSDAVKRKCAEVCNYVNRVENLEDELSKQTQDSENLRQQLTQTLLVVHDITIAQKTNEQLVKEIQKCSPEKDICREENTSSKENLHKEENDFGRGNICMEGNVYKETDAFKKRNICREKYGNRSPEIADPCKTRSKLDEPSHKCFQTTTPTETPQQEVYPPECSEEWEKYMLKDKMNLDSETKFGDGYRNQNAFDVDQSTVEGERGPSRKFNRISDEENALKPLKDMHATKAEKYKKDRENKGNKDNKDNEHKENDAYEDGKKEVDKEDYDGDADDEKRLGKWPRGSVKLGLEEKLKKAKKKATKIVRKEAEKISSDFNKVRDEGLIGKFERPKENETATGSPQSGKRTAAKQPHSVEIKKQGTAAVNRRPNHTQEPMETSKRTTSHPNHAQSIKKVEESRINSINRNTHDTANSSVTAEETREKTPEEKWTEAVRRQMDIKAATICQQFIMKSVHCRSLRKKEGNALEAELLNVFDNFIEECGYYFCKCSIPKSKFYALTHKILHFGINALTIKELGYYCKKIYTAAERLAPGFLQGLLLNSTKDTSNLSCCVCKNKLCCNSSESQLQSKVVKLEKEIEQAKQYLDRFKERTQCRTVKRSCSGEHSGVRPKATSSNTQQLREIKARVLRLSKA